MSTYTCQTCEILSAEIGKHLSQTRHKKVTFDPLDETVQCEDCGDSNIHLLHMLRYGLSDLALRCTECMGKDENTRATAEYTLANGTLFSKLHQYYKFRDISCQLCGNDSDLSVANLGLQQVVLCSLCLANDSRPQNKFVSENSEDFLFVLLGIKEYMPTPGTKLRAGGRKLGRKGGRERKPKKDDPDAERRRAHYENEKATRQALKSDKTMKARGSEFSPNISRPSTPKLAQNGGKTSNSSNSSLRPRPGLGKTGPGNSKVESKKNSGSRPDKASKRNPAELKKPLNPHSDTKNNESKSGNTSDSSSNRSKRDEGSRERADRVKKSNIGTKSSSGNPGTLKKSASAGKTDSSDDSNTESAGKSNGSKNDNLFNNGKGAKNEKGPKKEKGPKNDKPIKNIKDPVPATIQNGRTQNSRNNNSLDASAERSSKFPSESMSDILGSGSSEDIKLPPGVSKYKPSPTPKLTYDSMEEHFNEMCYNLFLEEKISLNTSLKVLLTYKDFELEWYADQDKKHKQYKVNVLLTPEFLNRYLLKKMQTLKKSPFLAGQSLILMLRDDIPWYGNIVLVDTTSLKPKRGKQSRGRGGLHNDSPKRLEMIVELYKWNKMPLPTTMDVRELQILPVSVPVSRVFTAMSRILNPRFIDMILGKTPIRQIFFKNYLKFSRDSFNESQKVAVQSVLNNSITVLQGPPGTGKTSTIYELILQLLENLNTYPILVVAASNIAIDNIAEKLLPKHGNSILRIVSMEKEPEYNREHPLASICLHHRVFDGMPAHLQELIREMRRPNSRLSANQYKKLLTAQISYSDKIIALSRVIFTTTVVAGGNQLKSIPKMPVVIMDEATQSSEPTTLIPLSMNGVEKFVFVGDQKQLSSFSQVPNLSLSLFERILLNGSYKTPHMLDTQYRMHPAISKFPREKFYGGLLKDGLTARDRQMDGIPSNPVVFWDTCGKQPEGTVFSRFREDSGLTYANKGEVELIEKVLVHLIYEKNIKKPNIGVITPYRGQRDLISSTLVKNDLVNPEKDEVHVEVDREDFFNESKPVTIHTVSDIMIASIDAFQGREKDFLIMSCVRSNKQNKIGFLSDARRMNVALTRAKYGLILIGDVECLKTADPLWREYIESLEEAGSIKNDPEFHFE